MIHVSWVLSVAWSFLSISLLFCCFIAPWHSDTHHTAGLWDSDRDMTALIMNKKNTERVEISKANKLFCLYHETCFDAGKLLLIHLDTLKSDSNNIILEPAQFWLIDLFCAAAFCLSRGLLIQGILGNIFRLRKTFYREIFAICKDFP